MTTECGFCGEPVGDAEVRGFCSLDCIEHESSLWHYRADDLEAILDRVAAVARMADSVLGCADRADDCGRLGRALAEALGGDTAVQPIEFEVLS